MLSAFTAQPLVELRQRDRSKIESISTHGDKILVGLNSGSLRIYRINEPSQNEQQKEVQSQPPKSQNGSVGTPDTAQQQQENDSSSTSQQRPATATKPVDLLREVENFSNRAIEQLAIIKEAGLIISLSNYYVSMHELESYTLIEQLVKTKNATTFAVTSNIVKDPSTGIPELVSRLAVAVKRKLLLWTWQESELAPEPVEVALSNSIRTLTWASATKIVCGMNSGYVIVDVNTQVEDIVGPGAAAGAVGDTGRFGSGSAGMGYIGLGGYVPKPLATRLAEGEILLAKDINTLFTDSDGKPLEKRQVPWQQAPESIGYSYPYMLSLLAPAKGTLEVRNPETLTLLQTMSLPNASQMHFPPPTVSLAHNGFHVVSDRCVWRMQATNYDSQVNGLVDKAQYDEAISLLNMLEDALLNNKEERLREVQMLKAQLLFDQRKYRDALEIFNNVSAPPERVIRLYPRVVAGELSTIEEASEDTGEPEAKNGSLNGDSLTKTEAQPEAVGSPKPAAGFGRLFMKQQLGAESDTASIRSSKKGEPSDAASINIKPTEDRPLTGRDLEDALLELNAFLVGTRNRIKKWLDPETGHLRPEALSGNSQSGQNGSPHQSVDMLLSKSADETDIEREKHLLEMAKLVDTTLFKSYMLVRPSLGRSLFRIPNFCDPDVVNEKLLETQGYEELVDFFHGKKLHRAALELLKKFGAAEEADEVAPNLHGPQRTVAYLQNLPPDMTDLILEFAEWPLRKDPDLGLEVFVADTENAETLPRDRVVAFLEEIDVQLAVKYLEHIITELNDLTPDFHNRLASAYLTELKRKGDRDTAEWRDLMDRLLGFLRSSNQYSLSKAFNMIPKEDPSFYEAQAVVLCNMGQHKQALEIYVFRIKDFEKAEEYCNRIHMTEASPISSPLQSRRPSTSEPDDPIPSIYHTLLSLYLSPPPPHNPCWPPALSLLSKHGSRLPASSTLDLIPQKLPVEDLQSYFQGRIRAANSIVNEAKIVAGLRKTEVVAAQAALLLGEGIGGRPFGGVDGPGGRNRRIVVTEERVCGVCHKRLGGSVVAALPDNTVVHYGCLNRVTGKYGSVPSKSGGDKRHITDNWKNPGWNISR